MSKNRPQTAFLLLIILVFSSCQTKKIKEWTSNDLLIPDNATVKSIAFPETITSDQASEDIDFLVYTLSKAYGGRQHAPDDSYSKMITALKNILNAPTLKEFHTQIDEALFLMPDNHMMAFYKSSVSEKRSAGDKVGHVGKNNIKNYKKIWETRIDRLDRRMDRTDRIDHTDQKKILYISILRFPRSTSDEWNGFIPSVVSHMKRADSIVIDLRGNSGGDDTKGIELAEVLFGHPIEHPIKRQYRNQTPETIALAENRIKIETMNYQFNGEKIPDYLIEDLRESKERYAKAIKGEIPPEYIRTNKGTGNRKNPVTGFKKPIYILIDSACGSSCEFTVAAFEWNNYVKKVGENTNGTFHFSNAGIAVLPNSKIKVMIPSQYSEYYDQRFIERIGFAPDIKVAPGGDAYTEAKKIIGEH